MPSSTSERRSVVWDIGAGSGSVAIEAAQLAHQGMVYAVEPEPADIALIQANAEEFGVPNVKAVLGRAPEILEGLPDPDASSWGARGGSSTWCWARRIPGCARGAAWRSTSRRSRGSRPRITN